MPDDQFAYKTSYRRFLPHIQPPGASVFVTFRLAGSIPAALHQELKAEAQEEQSHLKSIADDGERAQKAYSA